MINKKKTLYGFFFDKFSELILKEMYGEQFEEFVFECWGQSI